MLSVQNLLAVVAANVAIKDTVHIVLVEKLYGKWL
jgi:hypothetical protein